MAGLSEKAESLIAEATNSVRSEMQAILSPLLKKLTDAIVELESALDGPSKAGRRKKVGAKRGPKKGSKRKKASKGATEVAKGRRRTAKRLPAGALKKQIERALVAAKGPMKLAHIRNTVLKNAQFKGRDPNTLYIMIVNSVKKMDHVQKDGRGLYSIKK